MTSRSIRSNDIPNETYYFVSKSEFEKRIKNNEFLEYTIYYRTPKDKVNNKLNQGIDVILKIEIQGALRLKELVPGAIFIFILPPSMEELRKRFSKRGTEDIDKILNRFKTAYKEINEVTKYNYVVVNNTIDNACEKN